ncbi:hypothetical protein GOBAR_DD18180 [Gossypium barbadense]|nr:hypothetical protein GOBAR_DD18180 [Gossypium barbadense]
MHMLTNDDLGFGVLNSSKAEWEEFQNKWKELDNLFFSPKPEPNTLALIEEANDKEEEDVEEIVDPSAKDNQCSTLSCICTSLPI